MNKGRKIVIAIFLLTIKIVSAQKGFTKDFFSIHLSTLENKNFTTDEMKANKISVIVFLLPDCPSCQSYSLTLNELSSKFKSSGIAFYGVFPGHYNTQEEMNEYKNTYHINFLLLKDPDKVLVKNLNAKITPEAFVIDNAGNILYRGRIDDWMYAVGKKKPSVTTHELQDALTAVSQHRVIKVKETKAIGCIIE